MPKLRFARAPLDDTKERHIRTLAGSRHALGDPILRASKIVCSWDGKRTTAIAQDIHFHL